MDFNYMNKRSLFDKPQDVGIRTPFDFTAADEAQNPQEQPKPASRFSDAYSRLTSQEPGAAQKKYRDFLDTNEPNREDFKPTKMQRLAAILAGGSEGVLHGGAAGAKITGSMLDEPYKDALAQYDNQGKKLEASAGLEEKDMGRRVALNRQMMLDDQERAKQDETSKYHQGLLENGRERNKRTGFHFADTVEPSTGKKITHRIGPDGSNTSFDLGIGDLTSDQKVDQAGKVAGAQSKATESSRMKVAAAGIAARGEEARKTGLKKFENIKSLLTWKNDNLPAKYEGRSVDGQLVYFNRNDPNEEPIETGYDTGKLTDKEKLDLGFKNAKALKEIPKPESNKTVTKKDKDGNILSTTETKSSNSKAKVKMTNPAGVDGMVDADEVEEALKHGYKKAK